MTIIAQGVLMRIGTYDTHTYPDRDLREVHPARRDEAIRYKIVELYDGNYQTDESGWEHYAYKFIYTYLGRQLTVQWRCGTGYGEPKPFDGITSIFAGAMSVEYEAFDIDWMGNYGFYYETDYDLAERVYKTCERQEKKLQNFFREHYAVWRELTDTINS